MKLNQVWNIFRKDVRHHWIEIIVSLLLVGGFVQVEIENWSQQGAVAFGGASFMNAFFRGLAVPLLPVSWIFLIVRIVHGESLAGDRQFWVTRPYDWKQLLAAKILFVLAFVNTPLFLAHIVLLLKAGFHPTDYIAGLLWLQFFWTLLLLLPTAALAAITRNLGQMLLAILFVGLFVIAQSYLSSMIRDSNFSGIDWVDFALIIGGPIAIILRQYSVRRTTQSRWLLAGLAALLIIIMVATPYRRLIARAYPPAAADFPLQMSLAGPPAEIHYDLRDRVPLPIAFNVSGLPSDSFVELNGVILKLQNSSGQRWDSGWQYGGLTFFPEQKVMSPRLDVTEDVLDKLKSSPISADLMLAFTLYRDTNPRPLVVPRGEFLFPGLGFCSAGSGPISALSCRIALRRPTFLMVSSDMAAGTCPLSKDEVAPAPGQIVRAFIRGTPNPADPELSPVITDGITFWQASNSRMSGICPGTPLTVSNPEEAGRSSVDIHIDKAWFAAYMQALNKNAH